MLDYVASHQGSAFVHANVILYRQQYVKLFFLNFFLEFQSKNIMVKFQCVFNFIFDATHVATACVFCCWLFSNHIQANIICSRNDFYKILDQ